jgi:predicted  nucleic acid-binding Zn-ribbon protein
MDATVLLSVLSLVGTVCVAFFTYRGRVLSSRKDLAIDDRKTAKEIRDELRDEIKALRQEIDKWRDRSIHMEDELRAWKERYSTLEVDYYKALLKISELETRMDNEGSKS